MKTTKKKTMTKHLLLHRIFHFFDSLLTMWLLFLVCGLYCSGFAKAFNRGVRDKLMIMEGAKTIGVTSSDNYLMCLNYEERDNITKPGYWCQSTTVKVSLDNNLNKTTSLYIGSLDNYYYCLNYIIMPNITRTHAKLSVKYQTPAKINNLAFLTALLQ